MSFASRPLPLFFPQFQPWNVFIGWNRKKKKQREREKDLQSLLSRQQQGRRTSSVRSPIFRDYAMDVYIYIHRISYNPTFMKQTFLFPAFCVPRSIAGEFFQTISSARIFPNVRKICFWYSHRKLSITKLILQNLEWVKSKEGKWLVVSNGNFLRFALTVENNGKPSFRVIKVRIFFLFFFFLFFLFFFEILVYCPSFRAEKEGTEVEARRSFLIVLSKKGGYS